MSSRGERGTAQPDFNASWHYKKTQMPQSSPKFILRHFGSNNQLMPRPSLSMRCTNWRSIRSRPPAARASSHKSTTTVRASLPSTFSMCRCRGCWSSGELAPGLLELLETWAETPTWKKSYHQDTKTPRKSLTVVFSSFSWCLGGGRSPSFYSKIAGAFHTGSRSLRL